MNMDFENSSYKNLLKFRRSIQKICDYAVFCFAFYYLEISLNTKISVEPLRPRSWWCDGSSIHLLNNPTVSFFLFTE